MLTAGFKYANLNIYMTVHGMVFNNITPPHKTPNNVGQVEYCYTQIHGTWKSRAGIELLKFPCPFEIIYRTVSSLSQIS